MKSRWDCNLCDTRNKMVRFFGVFYTGKNIDCQMDPTAWICRFEKQHSVSAVLIFLSKQSLSRSQQLPFPLPLPAACSPTAPFPMSESNNQHNPMTTRAASCYCSSYSSCGAITHMNDDFLVSILQLLPVESVVSFSMTCRKFRSLGSSDALWESICRREWGSASVEALLSSPPYSMPSSSSSSSSSSRNAMVPWKRVFEQISHVGSLSCSKLICKDAAFPQPRASHSLNSVSGCLVLFGGGCEGGRHLDDTWATHVGNGSEIAAVSWHLVKSGTPNGRFGHTCSLVVDNLVLFGGISDNGSRQNDTWIGKVIHNKSLGISLSWEVLNIGAIAPPPRGAHACCSIGNSKLLIHGGIGLNGVRLDDMWLLDLSDEHKYARWQQITTAHGSPSPPARSGHSLTWISGRHVVLFGGRGTGYEVLNDLWIFNLDECAPRWLQVIYKCAYTPGQVPLPRVGHSATSILGDRVLIYGGEDSHRHRKDDFWILDIGPMSITDVNTAIVDSKRSLSKMWKRLKVEGQQPGSRSFHTACADPSGHRVYIFGGMVDGVLHPAEAFGLRFDGSLYLVELVIQ